MIAAGIDSTSADLRAALEEALLPVDDLTDDGRVFYSFEDDGRTVAFGGFELYGPDALLRSLVVLPQARGKGLGRAATEALLGKAFNEGARHAWLLTTSAAPFFEAAGFTPVAGRRPSRHSFNAAGRRAVSFNRRASDTAHHQGDV